MSQGLTFVSCGAQAFHGRNCGSFLAIERCSSSGRSNEVVLAVNRLFATIMILPGLDLALHGIEAASNLSKFVTANSFCRAEATSSMFEELTVST